MHNLLSFLLKYSYWFLFILLEIISFTLLFRFNNYQGSVGFTSANLIVGKIYAVSAEVSSFFQLKTINKDLTTRNVYLEMQVNALEQSLLEATADSSAILQIQHSLTNDYQIIEAKVVNNSLNRKDNYITLNKGAIDGVHPNMGVINGNGVVGIVYLTSKHYSLVIPVLNSKSSISCKIKKNDYYGYLKWEEGDTRYAYLKDLPRHALFNLGDTVVTSGYTAVFPKGITVGTINHASDSEDGLSYQLEIELATDFGKLNDVLIISNKNIKEQQLLEEQIK